MGREIKYNTVYKIPVKVKDQLHNWSYVCYPKQVSEDQGEQAHQRGEALRAKNIRKFNQAKFLELFQIPKWDLVLWIIAISIFIVIVGLAIMRSI